MQKTEERHAKQAQRELEDIVFTEANARWVHHPHVDALMITAQITNSNVHRLMVEDGSAANILYLNATREWV